VSAVICQRCRIYSFTPYEETMDWKAGDPPPPALSRLSRGPGSDKAPIWVCSRCGTDEAMREFHGKPLQPPDDWPVEIEFSFPFGA
jgi:hypothetical protein